MKSIQFNPTEIDFITPLLNKRLTGYQVDYKENKHINSNIQAIQNVLSKINSQSKNQFKEIEYRLITSVVNEFRNSLTNQSIKFHKLFEELKLGFSEKELQLMNQFDLQFSILEKTGYKKTKFRWKNLFTKIERIKSCEEVCFSRVENEPSNIYKIAFIDKNYYLNYEFESKFNLRKSNFLKINSKKRLISKYTNHMTKEAAKNIILNCKPFSADPNTLRFTKSLFS